LLQPNLAIVIGVDIFATKCMMTISIPSEVSAF